jgi:hypothetical protein
MAGREPVTARNGPTVELEVVAPTLALAFFGWYVRTALRTHWELGVHWAWVVLFVALPPQVMMYFFVQDRRSRGEPVSAYVLATEALVLAAAAVGAFAPLP